MPKIAHQRYVAEGSGAVRSVRTTQLHVRVTPDQLARFQLAAELAEVTLSRWVVELLTAAATPQPGSKGARRQRRP